VETPGAGDKDGDKETQKPVGSPSTSGAWRVVDTWGEADRNACITCIDCVNGMDSIGGVRGPGPGGDTGDRATVLVGRKNGGIDCVQVDRLSGVVDATTCISHVPDHPSSGSDGAVSVASIHGIVPSGSHALSLCALEQGGVVKLYDASLKEQLATFSCPPHVTCSAYHAPSGQLAVGCQGAELKMYSLSEDVGTLTYNAKGGKPDKVGICDKPWNSAMAFNPLQEDGSQIIVGTGHGKLRLYDTKVGKRPQLNVPFKEHRISSIAPDGKNKVWWVGDAGGNVHSYDVTAGKFVGSIKGIGGSVRSIDVHPCASVLVLGGLDRYVRVNSTRTRSSVMKLYVTSQLTDVKFLGLAEGQQKKRTESKGSSAGKTGKKRKQSV
jgi:WD40 repeat protein